jgi:pimeloyl-ACP methyl ester carboxylesterase
MTRPETVDSSPVIAWRRVGMLATLASAVLLSACAGAPVKVYTVEVPAGVIDGRARFSEIFCAVLKERGDALPDTRPCADALSHVAGSPQGTGKPVDLGPSGRSLVAAMVPGIGYACFAEWLQPAATLREHVAKSGYGMVMIDVDALSGTARNAGQIRDAIMAMPGEAGPPRIVLFGYSKGTPDVLEAVVRYPELQQRVAAVVSIAGAVGGSPLANDAKQGQADLLRHWPKARCDSGDGGAVESLRPEVRKMWLAQNPLPAAIRYYSVVTLPDPGRISNIVEPTYRKLSKIDPRNDSQVIYSDQIIPGSTLVGFLNADHWAVNVPIDRAHAVIGSTLVNHNDYPREALLEALLRYVEEDLSARAN